KTLVIVWKQIKNIAGGEQCGIKRDGRLFERNIHRLVIVLGDFRRIFYPLKVGFSQSSKRLDLSNG
ncbi:MAG: hypothetical protein WCS87_19415, partial [Methylococcaceae bacterium]